MTDNFVDFRAIKQSVSISSVLDRYGVRLRQVNQHSLRGLCPLPTHSSKESKESFAAHTGKNIWACQSSSCAAARAGKKGGNVLDFVAIMEKSSIKEAAEKLQQWFGIANGSHRSETQHVTSSGAATTVSNSQEKVATKKDEGKQKTDTVNDAEENTPLTFTLKDSDPTHSYLRSRGIKEETARAFGVGFFPGKGSMVGRVVIPIHNVQGELVAYAGRAIDSTEPKYKLPAGFHKSLELYNLHRVGESDHVIVVEGFFDTMKVHQAGLSNVVALMGCSLSGAQETLLHRFKSVTLFLDGDDAGREAADAIAGRLVHSHFVRLVSVPEGKQPDRLSSEEIRRLLA